MSVELDGMSRWGPVARRQLRYLGPVLVWMAVIATFSTDVGSSSRTTDPVVLAIHRLLSHSREPAPGELEVLSAIIRKYAHVFEYAVLGALLYRWLSASFPPPRLALLPAAVAIAGCYSALDELHQLLVPARTGSGADVVFDLAGAVLGAALLTWYRTGAPGRGGLDRRKD